LLHRRGHHAAAALLTLAVMLRAAPAAAQTRLPTGAPGPDYWQQRVDYRVEARLDPERRALDGTAWITYRNNSPDTLRTLHWHLYQNIFRPGSAGRAARRIVGRRMTTTRGITVRDVELEGRPLEQRVTGTLMETPLPVPLAPGDTLALRVRWALDVPAIASLRTGSVGEDFGMAQWYPQVAVYDDVHGWNTTPYRGQGEFYLEYGSWDVRLTLPARFLVAATGTLANPGQTLPRAQHARLAAVRRGRVTAIVAERDTGGAGTRDSTRTWHFTARDVRDFAWAASPRFLWNATRTSPTSKQPGGVLIHSFFTADERDFYEQSASVARDAIQFFSRRFGEYVYPQATVVSRPVEGMEYPMLVFEGVESRIINMPPQVTVHELAHQWYPMMIGSHETRHPFMDEGFATFITSLALAARYDGAGLWSPELPRFARGVLGPGDERRFNARLALLTAGDADDRPLLAHADSIPDVQLGANVYNKTSAALFMLRDVLGEETFSRAMLAYYDRWLLKHPYPDDFFRTVEDVAGRDLDWFWEQWFRRTWTLDVAVAGVERIDGAGHPGAAVALANAGRAVMPVTVRLTLEDGTIRDVRVPETAWRGGPRYTLRADSLPAAVRSVEVDPALVLLDTDRENNVWPRGTPPAAGPFFGVTLATLLAMLGTALAVAVAARVAGSLVGMRRAGLRVVRYGTTRLVLWSRDRGLHVGRRRPPRVWGGTTVAIPAASPRSAGELRKWTARAFAAGPLAGLAVALTAAMLVAALEAAYRAGARGTSDYWLDSWIFFVAVFALLGALRSLLPRRARGYLLHQPWLRLLLARGGDAERWSAAQALVAASHGGVRPRDWSVDVVAWAAAPGAASRTGVAGSVLAYHHALDRGDVDMAARMIGHARNGVAGRRWWRVVRRNVLAEAAFFEADVRADVMAAREALAGAGGGRRIAPPTWARANAAVALASGDPAAGTAWAAKGLAALDHARVNAGAGITTLEEELLRTLRDRCAAAEAAERPHSSVDVAVPGADASSVPRDDSGLQL